MADVLASLTGHASRLRIGVGFSLSEEIIKRFADKEKSRKVTFVDKPLLSSTAYFKEVGDEFEMTKAGIGFYGSWIA